MQTAAFRPMVFRVPLSAWLTAVVVLDIALLVALRLGGAGGLLDLAAQALLVGVFGALAVIDFRVAVAIAILELIVGGASGGWTVYPAHVYGRIVLDGIVFAVAVARLFRHARLQGLRRGRYTMHGLALALVIPGVWIPLGLLNGNPLRDAFGDGNGYLFLAFAVVLAAVSLDRDLGWLRRWVLAACIATALMTIAIALLALSGAVPVQALADALTGQLDMGGFVGYQGGLRVYLGSGLYLQVGVILVVWELLRGARRLWPWVALVLLGSALLATYTRGYWVGAILGTLVVAGLGVSSLRRTAGLAAAAVVLFAAGSVVASSAGFSLPDYVVGRLASVLVLDAPGDAGSLSPGAQAGAGSNEAKVVQAKVLLAHIAERPIVGWGFGTVAPDYPYGQSYSYELAYIALAYKTGIAGLLLFLLFPLRLLFDAIRGRMGRLSMPPGMTRREAAVPIAILCSVLVVGATNPYLGSAFGLTSVLVCIAWLDPFQPRLSPDAVELESS